MPIAFPRSWNEPDIEQYRDTVVRFIEEHMEPADAKARQDGNVGHALWRKAGAAGLLCTDIPEEWGGMGGDFRHEAVFYEEAARRSLTGLSNSVHSIVAQYLFEPRHRGAKAPLSAAHGLRRAGGCHRHDRARCRLTCKAFARARCAMATTTSSTAA